MKVSSPTKGERGRFPQPRLGKDCLHVLKRGFRAEAERAGSISALSPRVLKLLPALLRHVAHHAAVQIALENPALSSEPAYKAPDQSQVNSLLHGAEPQERPIIYVEFAGLDQSERASSVSSKDSALEFFSLG